MRLGLGLITSLLLAFVGSGAAAQEMKPPRLSFAQIDWPAAVASLADVDALGPIAMPIATRPRGDRNVAAPTLSRVNSVMAQRFAGIATSAVPVLLPFDIEALLRDQAAGTVSEDEGRYLSGFHPAGFFYPGPAGYDAAFSIRTGDISELANSKFAGSIHVLISGSTVLYELDTPSATEALPATGLEAEFPGIRRAILEHHLRYTFVRFGVPYAVSIACFDTNSPREKLPTCRMADQVAQRFLRALRVAGGMPQSARAAQPLPVERPGPVSQSFGYYGPGQILPGSGSRGQSGRVDYTVYLQMRFPLGDVPVYANSEVFQSRNRTRVSDLDDSPNISYAWRDNFCERRGFPVGQCPAGIGHQGQDMRSAQCRMAPGTERCEQYGDVLAARGGIILRSPRQEGAWLFVNSANEHIRLRYLHMSPRKMDADNLLSGRRVHEGEVIGAVGNYSMKEAGTSYHLHFDVQVLTRDGWVFVNPYMTLVAAYERMIGARGTELADPAVIANAEPSNDPPNTGSVPETPRAQPEAPARPSAKQSRHKPRWSMRRHRRYVRN